MRQNLSVRRWLRAVLTGAALLAAALAPARMQAAVMHELVVADPYAGVALFGFDPVSYFVDGAAQVGREAYEVTFARMTWRFRSEANRAAFRAQPDSYVPQFGGYDPIALTRGAPVAGHPALFVVYEDQLFLFHDPESRERFLAGPTPIINAARASWPLARRSLVH